MSVRESFSGAVLTKFMEVSKVNTEFLAFLDGSTKQSNIDPFAPIHYIYLTFRFVILSVSAAAFHSVYKFLFNFFQ